MEFRDGKIARIREYMDTETADVSVIGAGPAGVVVARSLAALGHRVLLVAASPRRASVLEGVSERAGESLRLAGCEQALGVLGPALPRVSTWAGRTAESGVEHLVDRRRLDQALLHDAEEARVRVLPGRCDGWSEQDGECRVVGRRHGGEPFVARARFVVEARGRGAPFEREHGRHGPVATALSRSWTRRERARPGSVLASFAGGWCWVAVPEAGPVQLQLTVSGETKERLSRARLDAAYASLVREIPQARRAVEGASPCSAVQARQATPTLGGRAASGRSLRVGDAALAIDPLAGQGIFEAVATALAAAPVVNTILRRPRDADLAARFHRERIEDTFVRLARAGRDAYRRETRWQDAPFWDERRRWPDDAPGRAPARPGSVEVVAVSEDGFVVERRAVVTPDHPRGVWRVDGVELVPLLERVASRRGATDARLVADYAESSGAPRDAVKRAIAWLRYRGMVPAAGRRSGPR